MPRQAADLEEALKKKGGLTLSQLANYDDILTDALVDRVRIENSRAYDINDTLTVRGAGLLLEYHPQTQSHVPSLPRCSGRRCLQYLAEACHC